MRGGVARWRFPTAEIAMPIVGRFVLDRYPAYRRLLIDTPRAGRSALQATGFVALSCAAYWTWSTGITTTKTLLAIVGLLMTLGWELLVLLGWWQLRKVTPPITLFYEVTESSMCLRGPHLSTTCDWNGIAQANIGRRAWTFRLKHIGSPWAVPREAFAPEAQQAIDLLVRQCRFQRGTATRPAGS
jgi:hypothetical protein